MSSAAGLGDVEGLADRTPDDLRVDAVGQRLVDRPAAEAGDRLILRHALGIHVAELGAHSFPERSETHRARLLGRQRAPARLSRWPPGTGGLHTPAAADRRDLSYPGGRMEACPSCRQP